MFKISEHSANSSEKLAHVAESKRRICYIYLINCFLSISTNNMKSRSWFLEGGPLGLRSRGSRWTCPVGDPVLYHAGTFTCPSFPNTLCFVSRLCVIPPCVHASALLHLLSQDRLLHPGSQHSKEERGEEGAEEEGHPGDGVGQHNLLPLPVHRFNNLIGQD